MANNGGKIITSYSTVEFRPKDERLDAYNKVANLPFCSLFAYFRHKSQFNLCDLPSSTDISVFSCDQKLPSTRRFYSKARQL